MTLRNPSAMPPMKRPAVRRFRAAGLVLGALFALPPPTHAQSLSDVFERVHRSVVTVRTTEREPGPGGGRTTVSISGQGSGVLISSDGKVLTAAHIVDLASEIQVELSQGERVRARVVASKPD